MLGMLGLLVLILFSMKFAAKPSTWYWLTGRPPAKSGTEQLSADPAIKEEVFRVRIDENGQLTPGAFRAVENDPSPKQIQPADASTQKPISADEMSELLSVTPEELSVIKDNTFGILQGEAKLYYELLARADKIPSSYIERAGIDDVSFAVLMNDSDVFRGSLITIEGDLRRLTFMPIDENSPLNKPLSEAWVFTADSGNNPYRVVCLETPPGIPTGESLSDEIRVRVTGYFFKRYGYAAQHGDMHTAPLLLAKRFKWLRSQPVQSESPGGTQFVLTFLVVFGLVLGFTLWRFTASDKRFHHDHLKRLTTAPQEAIDALQNVETTDIQEFLNEMSGKETPPEPKPNKQQ